MSKNFNKIFSDIRSYFFRPYLQANRAANSMTSSPKVKRPVVRSCSSGLAGGESGGSIGTSENTESTGTSKSSSLDRDNQIANSSLELDDKSRYRYDFKVVIRQFYKNWFLVDIFHALTILAQISAIGIKIVMMRFEHR